MLMFLPSLCVIDGLPGYSRRLQQLVNFSKHINDYIIIIVITELRLDVVAEGLNTF